MHPYLDSLLKRHVLRALHLTKLTVFIIVFKVSCNSEGSVFYARACLCSRHGSSPLKPQFKCKGRGRIITLHHYRWYTDSPLAQTRHTPFFKHRQEVLHPHPSEETYYCQSLVHGAQHVLKHRLALSTDLPHAILQTPA